MEEKTHVFLFLDIFVFVVSVFDFDVRNEEILKWVGPETEETTLG